MTIPRLVATDLDGTALRSDGTASPRTVAAFTRVERAGAALVLVTGRPPRWMGAMAGTVRRHGLAICANGALVYDLHTGRIVEAHLIEAETLEKVMARLRDQVPDLTFLVEYEDGFAYEPRFRLGGWDAEAAGGVVLEPPLLAARPAAKLLAQHRDMDPDRLHALVSDLVGDLVTATHSSGRALIEMSARGVTKASALARLAARYGIPAADAIAFGDMPNDLPMLDWAGTSYAVANAHPAVLAAVDHVTAANDDDGVAQVLERLYR